MVMFGSLFHKLSPCLVGCRYIFCRWSFVFYLSRDPTKLICGDFMQIYGWELLPTCHHSYKFGDHRHSNSQKEKCFIKKYESYKCILPLKNWVVWITSRWRTKCHNLKNVHFEKKCPKSKKICFPLMITFYNFTLKIETSCAKNVVKTMPMMLLCIFGLSSDIYYQIKTGSFVGLS